MDIKIVNSFLNENDYGYAVCECLRYNEGIQVPREEHTAYIQFNCPRCNKPLGITLLGKIEKARGELACIV